MRCSAKTARARARSSNASWATITPPKARSWSASANPKDAHALGLGMVYQHFTLVPAMTVAENLVLARDDVPVVVDWTKEKQQLEMFLSRMPFRVSLDARVSDISAGERQKCEILKQIYLKRRFLILDEPTSVLTPGEADEVLGMLRA